MWWHKSRVAAARGAAVLAVTLGVAACFRPLYGPTASGRQLDSVLASIDVADVAVPPAFERVSHYLRNELVFDLNGSGIPQPKQYRLALSFSESLRSPIVESTTGRAESATLVGTVAYKLTSLDGKQVLAEGTATSYATYDRTPQRFATVRAARDADIRLAKDLSDQIRTRLAVALSASS
jgi:LPS-assembly lipoprotein